jgi:HPt (histidine-containing phosphotransfer) domain-containing protein
MGAFSCKKETPLFFSGNRVRIIPLQPNTQTHRFNFMGILDRDILKRFYDEVCDNEIEILVDIAGDCINETQSLAKQIHTSYTVKDWEVFNRSAHSMKSTSKALGGVELSAHAEMMEHASSNYLKEEFDPSKLTEPVAELNQLLNSFVTELRNEVAKHGGTI